MGKGFTSLINRREDTSIDIVNDLHEDAKKASKLFGFKEIHFESLPDNSFDSVDLLDMKKIVEKYISEFKPDVVYTHHNRDRNIDHRITYKAVLTACRPIGEYSVKEDVYTFEAPSFTEWEFTRGDTIFTPNVFEDVTETLQYKLDAMKCYKTEIKDYLHPRSTESLEIIDTR